MTCIPQKYKCYSEKIMRVPLKKIYSKYVKKNESCTKQNLCLSY